MNNKIIISFVALIAITLFTGMYFGTTKSFGDVTNYNPIQAGQVTNTGVLCGTTSTLLMATSSAGRPFVSISNLSAIAVYLGFGNSAALFQGKMIPASTTIELSTNSIYMGAIYCIASSNASTSEAYVN